MRQRKPLTTWDGGSYNEETLGRKPCETLKVIKLRQRVMVDVSERSLATTIVGHKVNAIVRAGA